MGICIDHILTGRQIVMATFMTSPMASFWIAVSMVRERH